MPAFLRSLLILGRVSNLPTVWSNCLAGWLLAGGAPGFSASLLLLCAGCSCLYIGGMYLNDACDVAFDTEHRPERPIPAGSISRRTVTRLGGAWMAAGIAALIWIAPGRFGIGAAVLLAALIIAYDLAHKRIAWAPWLMALCRVAVYLVAGEAARTTDLPPGVMQPGGGPLVYWAAAGMGAWILALSYLARDETMFDAMPSPMVLLVLVPFLVGFILDRSELLFPLPYFPGTLLVLWLYRCLLHYRARKKAGPVVGDLITAIPLVDLMLVSPPTPLETLPFLVFMALALVLRRSIPQT